MMKVFAIPEEQMELFIAGTKEVSLASFLRLTLESAQQLLLIKVPWYLLVRTAGFAFTPIIRELMNSSSKLILRSDTLLQL